MVQVVANWLLVVMQLGRRCFWILEGAGGFRRVVHMGVQVMLGI